ncbi:hypothetical protein A4H97_30385 [Niastella yeongjuensis]|uniref:FecR protein domain-containing protein n=1 Tax=Niastella yeongjuensis TaxID=354355 RepID=A0A1V9EPU0_9BACT|nr:FecR domain-containing protein [Niastella yeongjuensis]OQP47915.1 hypothetical protein A4H97_30385 [Niastella yeongjuensis]SEP47968.1 FecR family protein [Niastella yeongjuensis]
MNDVEQLIIDKLTGQIGEEDDFNRHTHWWWYGIAAAVAGIVIVSLFLLINHNRNKIAPAPGILVKLANGEVMHTSVQDSLASWMQDVRKANIDPSALNTVMVPAGKQYTFHLSDGTKVWMNSISSLQFPLLFTQPQRNVTIAGEAYFKVAHASQPFTVQVNGLTVTALGTEFNIKSYNKESTYISLVTGSVSVQNGLGERIVLLPGEGVVVEDRNSPLRKEKYDESLMLGWMQGVYFFTNEKLEHLAVIAKRWLEIEIQIKDPTLAGLRFTGALDRNKPISHFLSWLASSGGIRYEIVGSKVVISRK